MKVILNVTTTLDDVSLVPIQNATDCPCNFASDNSDSTPNEEPSALDGLDIGQSIVLQDINFENDKADLLPSSFSSLQEVLLLMLSKPQLIIELSGHTSSLGEYQHNIDLSKRRAESVKRFLTTNGIEESRIQAIGFGPDRPIADNNTENGQALNRRVEFKIVAN